MPLFTRAAVLLVFVLVSSGGLTVALGQAESVNSVWDGVYTVEQSACGERGYSGSCASCHGTALEGGGQAPPLADRDLAAN